jgi:hypothetical protein
VIVEQQPPTDGGVAATWTRYWFTPADPRPLAVVRILTAALGLALLWSYAGDLQAWFGPQGVIPADGSAAWRPRFSVSVFDLATTSASLWAAYAATAVAFACLLVGLFTPVAAVAAAVLWASLLHRGPMLAGAADDCLAVLLWCLAVGPCGGRLSVDSLFAHRAGRDASSPTWRARVALGLVQVHVAAIAAAAVLAQLKGDVWWDGTAAWWLAVRPGGRLIDPTPLYARSEYLMNLVTHAIVAFEIVFAAGLWFTATQQPLARAGLVAWPLIGLLAGEPLWGCAMAIFCVPLAMRPPDEIQDGAAAASR